MLYNSTNTCRHTHCYICASYKHETSLQKRNSNKKKYIYVYNYYNEVHTITKTQTNKQKKKPCDGKVKFK